MDIERTLTDDLMEGKPAPGPSLVFCAFCSKLKKIIRPDRVKDYSGEFIHDLILKSTTPCRRCRDARRK